MPRIWTAEQRTRHSALLRGRPLSAIHRSKISVALKGNPLLFKANRANRHGGRPVRPADERFDEKVVIVPFSGGCHLWIGALNRKGYGVFHLAGGRYAKSIEAHSYADNRVNGPIPAGLERDHTCNVRCCVNVDHIERVT